MKDHHMTHSNLAGNEMHVTIWNDRGEIVVDEICKVQTASEEEITDMIGLIENGCPAHTAMFLARQHQDE